MNTVYNLLNYAERKHADLHGDADDRWAELLRLLLRRASISGMSGYRSGLDDASEEEEEEEFE